VEGAADRHVTGRVRCNRDGGIIAGPAALLCPLNGAGGIVLGDEKIEPARAREGAEARKRDFRVEVAGRVDIRRAIDGERVHDLIAIATHRLAPLPDAAGVVLRDEAVGGADGNQVRSTKVGRARKGPADDHVPRRVDGKMGALIIPASTVAVTPDVFAVAVELDERNVLQPEASNVAAPEVGSAADACQEVDIPGGIHAHRGPRIAVVRSETLGPLDLAGAVETGNPAIGYAFGKRRVRKHGARAQVHGSEEIAGGDDVAVGRHDDDGVHRR
jgi:hypothetical protein